MKRDEMLARRDAILADWGACYPVAMIAKKHKCSDSTVYRIARDHGQHIERSEREVEMRRAEQFADAIVKQYNEGASIDQIARQLGIHAREVRAAVYMAIQRGQIKAYCDASKQTRTT